MSDTGAFENKTLEPGDSFHQNFNKEGEYTYHDGMNPSMTGKIIAYNPKPNFQP